MHYILFNAKPHDNNTCTETVFKRIIIILLFVTLYTLLSCSILNSLLMQSLYILVFSKSASVQFEFAWPDAHFEAKESHSMRFPKSLGTFERGNNRCVYMKTVYGNCITTKVVRLLWHYCTSNAVKRLSNVGGHKNKPVAELLIIIFDVFACDAGKCFSYR